jgi:pimeloyl-ACP methyl ester carboxylesterase
MPRISLRDHKVHYQQTGTGPDVVLIHGLSCNIAFWWFHVAQQLALTHRVTAVDLRGHGFSGMTETGYRACDLADDVSALLDHLNISNAHVLAHSFGGAVATALTAARPDLVAELTLAEAWLPSLQPVPPIPGAHEWSTTRARAESAGIEIDPHLPLVVRALFSELLDEDEFQSEKKDGWQHVPSDNFGWEDPMPGASGFRESAAGPSQMTGNFWQRPGAGSGRGFWANRGGRWFGRRAEMAQNPSPLAATATSAPRDQDRADGKPNAALSGALLMAGGPGKPSQGIRRWQELMSRTHARTEFLDVTAIEEPTLKGIRAPVRLVYGARSQYRQTAEALETLLPQSKLQIIPRAAHYFPLLRPQALLQALSEPIEPVSRSGGSLVKLLGKSNPKLRLIASRMSSGSGSAVQFAAKLDTDPSEVTFPPATGTPRA